MKHLIIFAIILSGFLLLTLLSCYNKLNTQLNTQLYTPSIYIGKSIISNDYGRGVFANKNFNKDEIIESSPYIEDHLDTFNGVVRDYIFSKESAPNNGIVAFGFASMYNHSDNPNAIWSVDDSTVIIKTTRSIKKDEEIFISYGDKYWNTRKNITKSDDAAKSK